MARLLVVHHTPSPALHALVAQVLAGAGEPEAAAAGPVPVEVVSRPGLVATAVDALEADAYVLVTPANLGYLSGALKHFFDLAYYPCLDVTARRPFASVIHGNDDTAGARPRPRPHHRRAALEPGGRPGRGDRRAVAGRPRRLLGAGRHGGRRSWPRAGP